MHPIYQNQRHKVEPKDFFLGRQSNTLIQATPPENEPLRVECSIMRTVMVSAMEAELVGLFENC